MSARNFKPSPKRRAAIDKQAEQFETERTELREHAADTLARIIGADRTLYEFEIETGCFAASIKPRLSGEKNLRIDKLCEVAFKAGYRLRFVLEPLDTELTNGRADT